MAQSPMLQWVKAGTAVQRDPPGEGSHACQRGKNISLFFKKKIFTSKGKKIKRIIHHGTANSQSSSLRGAGLGPGL